MDDLIATTYVIGRALSAITFPGMYRIYDFHSSKAPKIKNNKPMMFYSTAPDESVPDDDPPPDPSEYSHMLCLQVGEDKVYIDDVGYVNPDGWTVLHTCCMSFSTVKAGLDIIDELIRKGGDLDVKTMSGPGSFNKGWTSLHMACAYGVEPLVSKLLQEGADANNTNCYGYTPLLEACHRGFVNVVTLLVQHGADLNFIPPEELSLRSPFVSAPAQSPLGEAARCGFPRIAQILMDGGADRDRANYLGWSPLHEACFYNRIETVKTLLLCGANAANRTESGALPFHLSGLAIVRTMLKEMGGPDAVPEAGDTIDMVAILKELTLPDFVDGDDEDEEGYDNRNELTFGSKEEGFQFTSSFDQKNNMRPSERNENGQSQNSSPSNKNKTPSKSRRDAKSSEADDISQRTPTLLHSGPMLGDLPAIGGMGADKRKSPTANTSGATYHSPEGQSLGRALAELAERDEGAEAEDFSQILAKSTAIRRERKMKESKSKSKQSSRGRGDVNSSFQGASPVDASMPPEFLCGLSQRPMSDPVETPYGKMYERTVIQSWMKQQGQICPLTGAPLAETDLKPNEPLRLQISKWILQRSMGSSSTTSSPGKGSSGGDNLQSSSGVDTGSGSPKIKNAPNLSSGDVKLSAADHDDLYDF